VQPSSLTRGLLAAKENSVLAIYRCTARGLARCYSENSFDSRPPGKTSQKARPRRVKSQQRSFQFQKRSEQFVRMGNVAATFALWASTIQRQPSRVTDARESRYGCCSGSTGLLHHEAISRPCCAAKKTSIRSRCRIRRATNFSASKSRMTWTSISR